MTTQNPFDDMIARYGVTEDGPVLFVREILGATPEPKFIPTNWAIWVNEGDEPCPVFPFYLCYSFFDK